jgi:hypothetical protein
MEELRFWESHNRWQILKEYSNFPSAKILPSAQFFLKLG